MREHLVSLYFLSFHYFFCYICIKALGKVSERGHFKSDLASNESVISVGNTHFLYYYEKNVGMRYLTEIDKNIPYLCIVQIILSL